MARLRTRWNRRDKVRGPEDIGSALAVNLWKLAGEAVLELENQDFQVDTYAQRLDVIAEFCAFQLHVVDRLLYESEDRDRRGRFVAALAGNLADRMHENRVDVQGQGAHRRQFVALLNARNADYGGCTFSGEQGPSFVLRRNFGEQVTTVVGERHRKWVTDYVMDVQVPALMAALERTLPALFAS